jgi:hypothetical protein
VILNGLGASCLTVVTGHDAGRVACKSLGRVRVLALPCNRACAALGCFRAFRFMTSLLTSLSVSWMRNKIRLPKFRKFREDTGLHQNQANKNSSDRCASAQAVQEWQSATQNTKSHSSSLPSSPLLCSQASSHAHEIKHQAWLS